MTSSRSRSVLGVVVGLSLGSLLIGSTMLGCDDSDTPAGPGGSGDTDSGQPGQPDGSASTDGGAIDAPVSTDAPVGTPPGSPTAVVATATNVSTLAGSGTAAFAEGTGAQASFNEPVGVAVDATGNVYVADSKNHRVRKVTSAGVVSTLAGSGTATYAEGTIATVSFNTPTGVAVDGTGNVYVADSLNHRIRKLTSGGVSSLLAGSGLADHFDGTGNNADFNAPRGLAIDTNGNLHIADTGNHRLRRVVISSKVTTSVAGGNGPPDPDFANGDGSAAKFNTLSGLAANAAGDVFIADTNNHRIRKAIITDVSTVAGSGTAQFADGSGATASFNAPAGAAIDAAGNVYIADSKNHRIRKMTAAGVVTTVAGSGTAGFADGAASVAQFNLPSGIAVDSTGAIYVGDTTNHRIRKVARLAAGSLSVTWTAPASGTAPASYKATATASGKPTGTCTATAPATTCTITGLESGAAYSVSVTALSGTDESTPSTAATATPN